MPDIFLVNGAIKHQTEQGQMIVCGQEYIHAFDEKEKAFRVVRKLFD